MFNIADKTIKILKLLDVCDEFNLILEEKKNRHLHLWIMPRHQIFKDLFGDITDNIGKIFDYAIKNWKTQDNIQKINALSQRVSEEFLK